MPKPANWCRKRCGIPMDAVLVSEGLTMHPLCEFPPNDERDSADSNAHSGRMVSQIKTARTALATLQPGPNRSEGSG